MATQPFVASEFIGKTVAHNALFGSGGPNGVGISPALWLWCLGLTCSYTLCTVALRRFQLLDLLTCPSSLEIPLQIMNWQTAAFGAVLVLNVINLATKQHAVRFRATVLLLFINAVAFITDLIILLDLTPVALTPAGRHFYPLRYIQWAHSTPSLLLLLSLMSSVGLGEVVGAVVCDVVMILTGMWACYAVGPAKGVAVLLSFGTFVVVLIFMQRMFERTRSARPEGGSSSLSALKVLLMALWSAFPVVWLLADWGLISPLVEHVCWGICDYMAKVIFSSQLWYGNLLSEAQKREMALKAWEDSNRVVVVNRLRTLLGAKERLVHALSHELKTPILGILALTGNVQTDIACGNVSATERPLAMMKASATCLLSIINTTLESAKASMTGSAPGLGGGAKHGSRGQGISAGAARLTAPVGAAGSGQPPFNHPPLLLQPLVDEVIALLQPLVRDDVTLLNCVPVDMPPVLADATRLSQIFFNLVGNAARFTHQGHIRIDATIVSPDQPMVGSSSGGVLTSSLPLVRALQSRAGRASVDSQHSLGVLSATSCGPMALALSRASSTGMPMMGGSGVPISHAGQHAASLGPGAMVEIEVSDTGIGIAQEKLDAIFHPYEQDDTDIAAANGGTGLGLYLVKLALDAHASSITAESQMGVGSTFKFRLPLAPPGLAAAGSSTGLSAGAAAAATDTVPTTSIAGPVPVHSRPGRGACLSSGDASGESESMGARPQLSSSACTSALGSMMGRPMSLTSSDAGNASLVMPGSVPDRTVGRPANMSGTSAAAAGGTATGTLQGFAASLGSAEGRAELLPMTASTAPPLPVAAAYLALPAVSVTQALHNNVTEGQLAAATASEAVSDSTAGPLAAELEAVRASLRPSHRHVNGGLIQVLSVDDDIINQVVAEQMLVSQKWKVLKAMDGMQALALTDKFETLPDLILLDIMMPGMSGFDVCARLRARFPPSQLPIIMVSAKSEEEDVRMALTQGADDYVTKPYKRANMVSRIRAHLRVRDALAAQQRGDADSACMQEEDLALISTTATKGLPVENVHELRQRAAQCAADFLAGQSTLAQQEGVSFVADTILMPSSRPNTPPSALPIALAAAAAAAGGAAVEAEVLCHTSRPRQTMATPPGGSIGLNDMQQQQHVSVMEPVGASTQQLGGFGSAVYASRRETAPNLRQALPSTSSAAVQQLTSASILSETHGSALQPSASPGLIAIDGYMAAVHAQLHAITLELRALRSETAAAAVSKSLAVGGVLQQGLVTQGRGQQGQAPCAGLCAQGSSQGSHASLGASGLPPPCCERDQLLTALVERDAARMLADELRVQLAGERARSSAAAAAQAHRAQELQSELRQLWAETAAMRQQLALAAGTASGSVSRPELCHSSATAPGCMCPTKSGTGAGSSSLSSWGGLLRSGSGPLQASAMGSSMGSRDSQHLVYSHLLSNGALIRSPSPSSFMSQAPSIATACLPSAASNAAATVATGPLVAAVATSSQPKGTRLRHSQSAELSEHMQASKSAITATPRSALGRAGLFFTRSTLGASAQQCDPPAGISKGSEAEAESGSSGQIAVKGDRGAPRGSGAKRSASMLSLFSRKPKASTGVMPAGASVGDAASSVGAHLSSGQVDMTNARKECAHAASSAEDAATGTAPSAEGAESHGNADECHLLPAASEVAVRGSSSRADEAITMPILQTPVWNESIAEGHASHSSTAASAALVSLQGLALEVASAAGALDLTAAVDSSVPSMDLGVTLEPWITTSNSATVGGYNNGSSLLLPLSRQASQGWDAPVIPTLRRAWGSSAAFHDADASPLVSERVQQLLLVPLDPKQYAPTQGGLNSSSPPSNTPIINSSLGTRYAITITDASCSSGSPTGALAGGAIGTGSCWQPQEASAAGSRWPASYADSLDMRLPQALQAAYHSAPGREQAVQVNGAASLGSVAGGAGAAGRPHRLPVQARNCTPQLHMFRSLVNGSQDGSMGLRSQQPSGAGGAAGTGPATAVYCILSTPRNLYHAAPAVPQQSE